MQRTEHFIEAEQKFKDTVDEFNQKNNRHIKIVSKYQNANIPVKLYEKTVINGKTYEKRWAQRPGNFEHGEEGNPLFNTGEADFIAAVDEFNQKNNRHVEIVGDYQNANTPVDLYEKTVLNGKTYENSWAQSANRFRRGNEGNPLFKTGKAGFIMAVDEFNRKNNRHIEIVSEYQSGRHTSIDFYEKTAINGKTYEKYWTQRPDQFKAGYEGNPLFNTGEADFIMAVDEFNQKNSRHVEIVGDYQKARTPVELYEKSTINGKIYERYWKQSPNNFERGKEGNPLFKTGEADFIVAVDEFNQKNNRNVKIVGEYKNANTPIELYEKTIINGESYENRWTQIPSNFEHGQEGNPLFQKAVGTSFIQEFLYDVFSQYFVPKGYSIKNRDTSLFDNYNGHPMELDIVVYDENHKPKMALEPGAWYRHKEHVEYDVDKLSICNENDLYCILIYFGSQSDYEQAIETERIKNYKSENRDIKDNIWIYPNPFCKPTCKRERDNLVDLVDALGRVMGVENMSTQSEISIDDAIYHADAIMKQSHVIAENNNTNGDNLHLKQVPEKFEKMLQTTNTEDTDVFER